MGPETIVTALLAAAAFLVLHSLGTAIGLTIHAKVDSDLLIIVGIVAALVAVVGVLVVAT